MTKAVLEPKPQVIRTAASVSLLCGLCHASGAMALGFGEIRLYSALNQPLDADIELVSLSESERESLTVDIASQALFERFGIERTALTDELRIELNDKATDAGRVSLHLSTRRAVREPFLRFLVAADTGSGRALREYTVLLDPPGATPDIAAAPAVPRQAPLPARYVEPQTVARQTAPSGPASAGTDGNRYGPVTAGDTLFDIAVATRWPETTPEQMTAAIFRANPAVFNGNMNTMSQGAMLSIPAAERVRGIAQDDALDMLLAQHKTFAASTPQPGAQKQPAVAGNDAAKTTPANPRPDAKHEVQATRRVIASNRGVEFGRMVEPDFDAYAVRAVASNTAGQAKTQSASSGDLTAVAAGDAGGNNINDAANAVPAVNDAGTASVESDVLIPSLENASNVTMPSPENAIAAGIAPQSQTAVSSSGTSPIQETQFDVAADDQGLFSPRNVLLLSALIVLGSLLGVWYRRRQYESFDIDLLEAETAVPEVDKHTVAAAADDDASQAQRAAATSEPEAPAVQEPAAHSGAGVPTVPVPSADRKAAMAALLPSVTAADDTAGTTSSVESASIDEKASNVGEFEPEPNGERGDHAARAGDLSGPDNQDAVVSTFGSEVVPAVEDPPVQYAIGDRPESQVGTAPATEDDDAFYLETEGTGPGNYDWQAQDLGIGREREHDRSDDAGMAFEPEIAGFAGQHSSEATGTGYTAVAPDTDPVTEIDAGAPDIDTEAMESGTAEADPVDIRLDRARKYLDMEERAAARKMLEDVVGEGDRPQRDRAQELLEKIA